MQKFMSLHRAPGLLPENWDDNSMGVLNSKTVRFVQGHVNLSEGFIFSIWETASKDALIDQLEEWGMPFEEIFAVEFSQSRDEMEARLKQLGRI